jgi:hypothetical protein
VLDLLAAGDRRDLALSVTGRPDALQRLDVDKLYRARAALVLEVGTLSPALLRRTGRAPYPQKAVAHALELLEYASAKGVVTRARFEFNQPGETEESAGETLDALERFIIAVPSTSVTIDAQPWAFLPIAEEGADVEAPASRFGTRIEHPEWWKERTDAHLAATAVVASHELAERAPGDDAYWRPRFEELRQALDAKLTAEARRASRSRETVGAGAYGVPHGWWTEPRWH